MKRRCLVAIYLGVVYAIATCFAADTPPPAPVRKASAIDSAMYFNANVRDAQECNMRVLDGRLVAVSGDKRISNPAMTCPDMFSWNLFVEVVRDRFWSAWPDERQNWPAEPYRLCGSAGAHGAKCCDPDSNDLKDGHCPVFPGEVHKEPLDRLNDATDHAAGSLIEESAELMRHGRPSMMDPPDRKQTLKQSLKTQKAEKDSPVPVCTAVRVNGQPTDLTPEILRRVVPDNYESVGRVIRQTNAELTVRNRVFHDYLYRNNLYNADGVMEIFRLNAANLLTDCPEGPCSNAPYHLPNRSVGDSNPGPLLGRIEFPFDSIMIKSNWLHRDIAERLKLERYSTDYISKHISTSIDLRALRITYDTKSNPKGECKLVGQHYLLAFHISSKDIPNWVWTSFEHVNLPGRCDFTGCNDSYGYFSSDRLPPGTADNYVAPKQSPTDHLNSPSSVFAIDQGYAVEEIRPSLKEVFRAMEIATGTSTSQVEPDPEDRAWLSYRLKGSQVEYVGPMGRPTILGNSVTEGGFMLGSSCISCHSRAGIHVDDTDKFTFSKLSIFLPNVSEFGYAQGAHGIPDSDWFHDSANLPALDVLQTDFIWGFLLASPVVH